MKLIIEINFVYLEVTKWRGVSVGSITCSSWFYPHKPARAVPQHSSVSIAEDIVYVTEQLLFHWHVDTIDLLVNKKEEGKKSDKI